MPPASCSHRPPCPGCPAFGRRLGPELDPLRALAAEAGIELEIAEPGPAFGYRIRSRLAVRGRSASPKLGIFEQGSHQVVDIPRCPIHHPLINEVAAELRAAMRELNVAPYAEASHRGLVRYLQVVVERSTQTAQVVLVINAKGAEPALPLCARLQERLGTRLHSLFVSPNDSRGNRILGERCDHICGPLATEEHIAGARVFFPPDAFGQANLNVYDKIVERIGTFVPDGADVTELYAGTGAIGLSLVPRVRRVRTNEIGEGSLRGLALGVAELSADHRARIEAHPGDAVERFALLEAAGVVVVDPPRKGLPRELSTRLCSSSLSGFVYLSCSVDSFVQDARKLLDGGALRLGTVVAYDLFPNTGHVETLAHFCRR